MGATAPSTFGVLLRRFRQAAALTQEALGERAGLSARGISDLERGISRAPQQETAMRLADALALPQEGRERLLEAARSRASWPGEVTTPQPGRPRRPEHPPAPERTAGLLVGRAAELALLERHLAGAGPPLLLLAGMPGIGKSRLLREAATLATGTGWVVLAGGCQRRGGQEPYTPVLEALQQHLLRQLPDDLRAQLRGCAWLVRLLPELADGPIPPLPPWTASPAQERRLMVEAVRLFLANIAGPAGTLLLLDDLQWAGQDALDLIGALVRWRAGTPLRLIAAYRDTELPQEAPLLSLLGDLAHAGLAVRRALGPLARTEAAQLLDGLLGAGDGAPVRHERLLRRTGGVPFFLVSCAQALREGEDQDGEATPWDVAQSVRQRMATLPAVAQEVLRAAAVVGRVTARRLLAAMLPGSGAQVLDALEVACRGGLLEEEDRASYRFAHDIVREVVYGDLGAARRAALHQQAGEALERLGGAQAVEILAYHYSRSDAIDKAVPYLERAGDRAAAQFALLAAEGHYRDLVRCLESLGRRYEAARVYAKLGLQLKRAGRLVDSKAALRQVVEAYGGSTWAAQQEPPPTAATAGDECRPLKEPVVSINTVLSLMEEHEPEHTRGVLYLALALYLCNTSRSHESLTVTEQAVHLARLLNDGSLLAQALEERSLALFMVGRHGEAFAPAREALHLCEERGDLGLLGEVLVALVYAHVHRGEFGQGNLYNDRTLEIADALGDTYAAAWAHERRAWIAKYTGHWERALADLARALQLAPALAHDPWFNCMRGELCLVQGAWDDAAAFFEQAIAEAASLGLVPAQVCTHAFLAELDVLQGRPAAAVARAHAALAQDIGEYAPMLLTWAAQGYLHMGEVDQAAAASARAAKGGIETDDCLQLAEALRVQALVASARERWLEAEQALAEGLALTRRIGYPHAEARLLHAYGLMHIQKGEAAPARERFDAALAIFRRLGARKDIERVEHDLIDLYR